MSAPEVTIADLTPEEQRLYGVIPEDGAIGNGDARSRLGWQDNLDRYWSVRNALIAKGLLVTGRGRGGSVQRVTDRTEEPEVADGEAEPQLTVAQSIRREHHLYPPIQAVLATEWAQDQDADFVAVETTAWQGRRKTGGKWSRPDLVTVEVKQYDFVPGRFLEVMTFEVKPADAIDVQALYEALAHRRAATHAYVLLHVPGPLSDDLQESVKAVQTVAATLGIGVVTFDDPGDFKTWAPLEEAERREPDPELLNDFIRTQLTPAARDRIRAVLGR